MRAQAYPLFHAGWKRGRRRLVLALAVGLALTLGAGRAQAVGPANSYTSIAFADGFESGALAWNGLLGNGSATVTAAAAHTGTYGLRIQNASGQFQVAVKSLPSPLVDSSTTFWIRVASGGGFETVAEARDGSSSAHMWDLYYDGANHALDLFAYRSTGSVEIYTGANTVPADFWVKVEVQYTATGTGGARLYVNDQTQPSWTVSGDFTRTSNLQIVQLWNDIVGTTDFDDVSVGAPAAAGVPGPPTGVTGTAGNGSASLNWTAPASNGGSAITGYRVTPYVGGTAQSPILTGSTATSYNVTGLTNGTAYTFTVAAINANGTGADSAASAAITPSAPASAPGAPTGVTGWPADSAVSLSWTAPASNGGSAITSYRITPFIGATAQTPIDTGSSATTATVSGLTNGTAYTFTVAATNAIGTGTASAASAAITPKGYTNQVFSDGFESGTLAWNGLLGNGSATVVAAAAHAGTYGLRLTNTTGQFQVAVRALPNPLVDSSTSFWVRPTTGSGLETIAQARDGSSSMHMWDLYYDWNRNGFVIDGYKASGSDEIFTGVGSAPVNVWTKVEVQYTATATGGMRILVNGASQAAWAASGDYRRTANLQRLQIWNDAVGTTDFDDVAVATVPNPASLPGAPTGVAGTAGNASVALTWTAPSSDGGSPITGYVVTPYVGGVAQTPRPTGSTATSFNVTGLTNGTAYTFTVAAVNAIGTGPESAASATLTPLAAQTVPGAPSAVTGVAGDKSVSLSWTPPSSNGGSAITSYRITPFIGTTAQTPVNTGSSSSSYVVTGLTNGTTYTFVVAATNAIGTGANSAASPAVMPKQGYTNVVFQDGFESGSLSSWDGSPGTGTTSVTAAASHSGSYGLRTTNASGQYDFVVKALPNPLADSSTSFWVRIGSGGGYENVAQARDGSSGLHMWDVAYDGQQHGLWLYAYTNTGSNAIFTGANTVPADFWVKVEVQYTATSTGGAQLYVNGVTQPSWGLSGNYARTANLQRIQLWNDALTTTDFDDVRVAVAPPPGSVLAGAPTNVTGIPRDRAVALSWNAPASDGGSAISDYRITPRINGVAQTPIVTGSNATSYTVSNLTNGTAYTFTVAAINGVGTGPDSTASGAVTPAAATVPGAPTGVTATAKDSSAVVSWTAPASDGGAPITGYVVTPYVGGTAQPAIPTPTNATTYTVPGLTNGTAYTFTVAASNAIGTGSASAQSASVTPKPALSQYTNVVFSDGFESGGLTNWDVNQGTGGRTVVPAAAHAGGFGLRFVNLEGQYGYVVKALSSPITDGIVTFWIRPTSEPGMTMVSQARDGASSSHMWDLAYDGTRHGFIFYPYTNTGSTELFTGTNSAASGVWVKVTVQYTATNPGGAQLYLNGQTQSGWGVTGNYTRTTNLQRIQLWNDSEGTQDFDDVNVDALPPVGANPPNAPTAVTVAPLDSAASVSWTAPASDGGSPITGYQITPWIGGVAQAPVLTGTTATTFRVAGLTNGTSYTFTVAALNAAGTGIDSAPSAPVTPVPAPPPGAPTGLTAVGGDRQASLSWTAPASDGGSAITNYRITPSVGGTPQAPVFVGSAATTFTVTGLTNGTTYTFTVAATNSSGYGAESTASPAVTPAPPTVPGAPTGVSGSPRDSSVALNWTAPGSDGGSPITGYRITPFNGSTALTPVLTGSTATGFTVNGLTNGTTYTFKVAAINAVGTGPDSAASGPVTPAIPPANPIVLENRQQGTTSWQLTIDRKAENHEIEGYASLTSVNKGSPISFMVSLSSSAQYTMDIYRLGWYPQGTNPDGSSCAPSCGARLMLHVGPLQGSRQTTCAQDTIQNDTDFGLTECAWTPSYTLSVPSSWTTGAYIVKLKRLDGQQLENYVTFAVRDDSSTAPIVYGLDTSTWQAYNYWGGSGNNNVGYSLYGRFNDVTGDPTGGRAYTVSFDRPYSEDGAGKLFDWDFPLIRWMESQGYDISYVTSSDLDSNTALLSGHKVFVNTGHDEYYSDGMRQRLVDGIAHGTNMAFFSANNFYYRITWGANGLGSQYRRIHSDKNALPNSTTYEWRLLPTPHPENEIGGVMLIGVANDRPYLVSDASSWIYAGTGLKNYTGNGTTGVVTSGASQNALPGIIGYEVDAKASTTSSLSSYTGFEPANTHTVGHSFVPAGDGNATNIWSDATLYTASSGATVFSAGTIQWGWGLDPGYNDGYCGCSPGGYVNAATQRITANILNRFTG